MMHGIKTDKQKESLLKPKQCSRCLAINSKDARFCQKCSSVLDINTAIDLDQQRRSGDELMAKLMKDPEIMQAIVKRMAEMGLRDKLLKDIGRGEI